MNEAEEYIRDIVRVGGNVAEAAGDLWGNVVMPRPNDIGVRDRYGPPVEPDLYGTLPGVGFSAVPGEGPVSPGPMPGPRIMGPSMEELTTGRGQERSAPYYPPTEHISQTPSRGQTRDLMTELFGQRAANNIIMPGGQPLTNPQERELMDAQQALSNAQLGPADRNRMQELANSLRQIQIGAQPGGDLYPVDAHRMWQEVYPEFQALQQRQAQVPLLARRLAAIQTQQDHAVASSVNQQRLSYDAANTQSRVMRATLDNGTVVNLMRDDRGGFHQLNTEPIFAIPEGYRTEREIANTILEQQRAAHRIASLAPGSAASWPATARSIAEQVHTNARQYRAMAMQATREERLSSGSTGITPQQRSNMILSINDRVTKAVERQRAAEQRARTSGVPGPAAPAWMASAETIRQEQERQRQDHFDILDQSHGQQGGQQGVPSGTGAAAPQGATAVTPQAGPVPRVDALANLAAAGTQLANRPGMSAVVEEMQAMMRRHGSVNSMPRAIQERYLRLQRAIQSALAGQPSGRAPEAATQQAGFGT
jgi:hypothetical protein